jgi:prepilin-type processing-associated H-X9-DG protein
MIPLIIANSGIPYFAAQTYAGILLLIPVIIIEAILLKIILGKKWLESFIFCTIANLFSTFVGFLFIFIEIGLRSYHGVITGILLLLSFFGAFVLSVWVEYIEYKIHWKDIHKRKLLKTVIIVNIITYIPLIILAFYMLEDTGGGREKARRISCNSNLKSIGVSMAQYAMNYNDYLPNKPGVKGFEQLRSNDYLTAYEVFLCPSNSTYTSKDNQELTDEIVDYIYQNGYKIDSGIDNSKIPVVWDKPENHEDYGNVLFLDGHVEGFEGKNWMEQAGIKKTANKTPDNITKP